MPQGYRISLMLFCLFGLSGLAACEPEAPPVDPGLIGQLEPEPTPEPEPVAEPEPEGPQTRLEILGDDVVEVIFSARARVQVRYTNAAGVPIAEAPIEFRVLGTSDLSLEATTATTDGDGVATNSLIGGMTEGLTEVLVSAKDAEPVKYTVFAFPLDEAAYRVQSRFEGAARLVSAEVRLLEPSVRCGGLSVGALPAPEARQEVPVAVGRGIPDVVFEGLANGSSYTVVTVGFIAPRVPAAFGCVEGSGAVEAGRGVLVEVELEEVAPEIAGDYGVLTRLDLTDGLPEPWRGSVQFVGEVFADPVGALVGVLFGDPNDNGDGLAGDFIDDTPARRALVQGILTDMITATAVGQQLEGWFGVGGEAYGVVTRFGLEGGMEILAAPDERGRLADRNPHYYEDIVIDWSIGCAPADEACRRVEVPLSSINGLGAIEGAFGGRVEGGSRLFIDRHGFDFNYGAIAVAILERVVLPRTFGVGSINEALRLLVDCGDFGDGLFPGNFVLSPLAAEACELALDYAVDEVVARLSGAGQATPELTLATFDQGDRAGCLMGEPEYLVGDVLRRVGAVGTAQARCAWDARFDGGGQEAEGEIEADFFATSR